MNFTSVSGKNWLFKKFNSSDVTKFTDLPHVEKVPKQVAYLGRESFEKGIDILKGIESKIEGNVKYCTSLPWNKAMEILKASHVLVLPSRVESIPQSIKEAFFLKIPVVGTDVGGIPELIKNNETGLLVPPNEPQKLAESVNKLLENKQNTNQLTNSGYEFIKNNMTWDIILPKYIEFYENLLKN